MKKHLLSILFLIYSYHSVSQNIPNESVLFDDFNYNSISVPNNSKDSNSIFGYNPWLTNEGYDTAKAWFRWNTGDPEFAEYGYSKITRNGISLGLKKGKYKKGLNPIIHSTFLLKHGTFAARVKFEKIPMENKITNAFWLISDASFAFNKENQNIYHYREEIDFEWNNWWYNPRKRFMSVGCSNKNYYYPITTNLNCILINKTNKIPCDCDTEIDDIHIVGNQWSLAVFVVDTINKQIKISFRINKVENTDYEVLAGHYNEEKKEMEPFIIGYDPYYDYLTVFSNAHILNDTDNEIKHDSEFEIDWFLYSPSTNLTYDDIEELVDKLKDNKIDRINTVGATFFSTPGLVKDNYYLDGPVKAKAKEMNKWIIRDMNKTLTGHFDTEFMYRYHKKNGDAEQWNKVYSIDINLTPANYHDSIEFLVYLNYHWEEFKDTIHLRVPVVSDSSLISIKSAFELHDPRPNPVLYVTTIGFDLYEDMNVELIIYDEAGNLVEILVDSYLKMGTYSYEFWTHSIGNNIYYCTIITPFGSETKILANKRYEFKK